MHSSQQARLLIRAFRGLGSQTLWAAAIVAFAAVWAWIAGSGTARVLRDLFAALDPELMLEIAAGFLVLGSGLSLMQATTRWRGVARLGSLARLHERLSRVPTLVALCAIVSFAALFRVVLASANHYPKVLGDELVYSGLAKGWALHGQPLLRGSREVGYSTLYPLLVAPTFRLASDGAAALATARVVNAIAMALTAVPAYLLAKRAVPRGWALGVAALSVLVPWTAYSALTMTESLFYPTFVGYAAILAWTLERPSALRQAVMLAVLLALVGVRAQGLTVALGTVAAILVCGALDGAVLVGLRRFLPTLAVFGLGLAVGVAAGVAGVAVPTSPYNAVFDSLSRLGGMVNWGTWSIASFELALGVVAVAALPVALRGMLRAEARPPVRATGAVVLTLTLSLLASVALLSASPYGLRQLHERSLFYVTPLLLTALAHWLWRGLERPLWLSLGCAAAAVSVAAALPKHVVFGTNNVDAPSASFFLALDAQVRGVPFRVWAIAIAAIGAGTFLFARRPLFPLVTLVIAFVAVTARVDYRDPLTAAQARALSWVDHSLPAGVDATLVHVGLAYSTAPCAAAASGEQQNLAIWTEFFNTRIDAVTHVYEPNAYDGLRSTELTVGSGGLILSNGHPFRPAYVVIDSRQPIVGKRLARFDLASTHSQFQNGASLTMWRVDPPLRFYPRPEPLPPRADGRSC